jgi:hypothetical protein
MRRVDGRFPRCRFHASCGAVLLGLAGVSLAGCYHHVIRAEGLGQEDVEIYEPNVSAKPGPLEQFESAVWNDEPKSRSRSRGNTRSKPD